jgi:succinoglycan biosynthesis protein ExoV
MKLYYFRAETGNFGDDLNLWLWPQLLGRPFDGYCHHSLAERAANEAAKVLFIGIGTLLNTTVPDAPEKIVFGAGAGYGPPPRLDDRWRIFCVRGPLTARALGLPPELVATDPAALVPLLDLPAPAERFKFAYMPHVRSAEIHLWREVCDRLGIRYISPEQPVRETIADLLGSDVVITEAMHGAIVSDALRIPWIPVRAYQYVNEFKWQDWCRSMRMTYRPASLTSLWSWPSSAGPIKRVEERLRVRKVSAQLRSIMKDSSPVLSADAALQSATDRLQDALVALRDALRSAAMA